MIELYYFISKYFTAVKILTDVKSYRVSVMDKPYKIQKMKN